MKGISLEESPKTTKISVRYLKAIEEGHFEKLPRSILATSYMIPQIG